MTPSNSKFSGLQKGRSGQRGQIRKRHWCLGTLVILAGSWMTHTSTATISAPKPPVKEELVGVAQAAAAEKKSIEVSAPTIAPIEVDSVVEPPVEKLTTVQHKIKRGESLGTIFRKQQLPLEIPHRISQHEIAKQLVSLRVGKTLQFKFDQQQQLKRIVYPSNSLQELVVELEAGEIVSAAVEELSYIETEKAVSGEITSSLYEAGQQAGLSNAEIMEMVRIFGWDIDFVQDIRSGDSFHVILSQYEIDGEKVADGNIIAAEFTTQGNTYTAVRYTTPDGEVSYYTPEGESMLGTFLRSPVEFSRISSRFGKRRHPISKKWKTHKGVDYAAGRGTPIRATADGKVALAGRKGGYGKTVVLHHAGRFSTLYAHMNGFAKGVRAGQRVKQGQVIGYVGSTGYSTGPHLHYEFRVDGVHRNSLTYKTPKASSIGARHRVDFEVHASQMLGQLNTVNKNYQLAKATKPTLVAH